MERDKGTVYVEFHGPADELGRRPFALHWWGQDCRWRAQEFRSADDHGRQLADRLGRKLEVMGNRS